MNMWAIIGAGLATIIALIVATFLVAGAERFWRLFGEPDLGPVSFEQLERRATPNDSLACPPDFCKAGVDVTTRLGAIIEPMLKKEGLHLSRRRKRSHCATSMDGLVRGAAGDSEWPRAVCPYHSQPLRNGDVE
jgi:hypothetical protein